MKATIHVPMNSFGYIEREYENATNKQLVADFKELSALWAEPEKGKEPLKVGDKMVENGHTYIACQNEKTGKLFWLIDKI